jgi:EAL domain-containing protein (putative c-di-GMP-specific phosphodiesterase class I)
MGFELCLNFTIASASDKSVKNIFYKIASALYFAQKNKLPYVIYEDSIESEVHFKQNIELFSSIKEAIINDNIIPYYQPIIDNKTNKIIQYEVLARLKDKNSKLLAPSEFIDISKKIKIYHLIIKKIFTESFKTFKDNNYNFSINISIDDILNQETYDFLIEKLKQNPDLASRVIFEITESQTTQNSQKLLAFTSEIKRYGAKIAIDDFGRGYSNFSMLLDMKADYLKIDGELISKIDTNQNSLTIIQSIVEFAKKLEIKTVAEYVYSSTILSKVKSLDIDYSQGFYIDKPKIEID